MQSRTARLATALDSLRQRFGSSIIRLAADLSRQPVEGQPPLSTGSLGLDLLVGGLPRGTIVEFAGVDGSGRETLAITALARAQQQGCLVLLVDPGNTSDPDALLAAGVDLRSLTIASPTTAAQAWTILDVVTRCGALDVILVSSLSSLLLLPGAVTAGRVEKRLARLWLSTRGRRTAVLITNTALGHGCQTVGEAGMAQQASLRVLLESRDVCLGPAGEIAGLRTLAHVTKYRGRPWGPALPLLIGPAGPDRGWELLELAKLTGLLSRNGLGYQAAGMVLGKSETRAALTLREDDLVAATLEAGIRVSWPPSAPVAIEEEVKVG
jgi:recombination protein RecA